MRLGILYFHLNWDLRLPCCEFAINSALNAATGSTSFFLNTGAYPRSPVKVNMVCKLPAVDAFVGRINAAIARAKDSLLLMLCRNFTTDSLRAGLHHALAGPQTLRMIRSLQMQLLQRRSAGDLLSPYLQFLHLSKSRRRSLDKLQCRMQ